LAQVSYVILDFLPDNPSQRSKLSIMQWSLVAFSFLVLASGTRSSPKQGKMGKSSNPDASVSLRSTYNRLVKAAAQVEQLTGDASLLTKGKRSKAAERALVQDPQMLMHDAVQLVNKAYAVIGKRPPAKQSANDLKAAYREMLAAAEGIELVRRQSGDHTAFVAAVHEDPEKIESDVEKLKEDMKEAEEEVDEKKEDLKEVKEAEEKVDDKKATAEAEAANKAANQELAEAEHEQHGGHEMIGEATRDKEKQEKGAADKAEAKAEVAAATEEHKAADEAAEKADKVDDAHEEKVEKAEEKLEEAEEEHHEAIDEHNEKNDMFAKDVEKPTKTPKSSASKLASFSLLLIVASLSC